jgi:phage terminase large subunit
MTTQQQEQDNPILQFMVRYADDPVGFVRNVLGVEPDVWQVTVLEAVARGERRISIRSGHGVGKTSLESWICCWSLTCLPLVKIIITAPSGPQLWDALFAEIKLWMGQLPEGLQELFVIGADRIEAKAAPERVFLSARTSRAETPEAMQGVHAEGGRVILIADEASGIPEQVYEAGAGSMSGEGCTTILAGNPTRAKGFFFDTHHKLRHMWLAIQVSCLDCKRVSADFVTDMAARYGELSNAYRVRVLGEFPLSDDDTYIPLELVEAAQVREIALDPGAGVVWGLDVARFGKDSSSLVKRRGNVVTERPRKWRGLDTMQLVGALKNEFDTCPPEDRPGEILVDVIGIGAGVVDRAREVKLPVRGINVAESPAFDPDGTYSRLRDELWGKGKAWLEKRSGRLPQSDDWLELCAPRFSFLSNGKLKVESKDEMRRRNLASPDSADAFLLTFASDAAVSSGSGASGYRTVPSGMRLKRGLKGVV